MTTRWAKNVTDNERVIKLLDEADAFLRNRVISAPQPLNKHDVMELIDIADVCGEAANIIMRQSEQLETLKRRDERWHSLLGFGE